MKTRGNSGQETQIVNGPAAAGRYDREVRRAEQRSVGKCLPSSHRKRRGPELEPSRLGLPAPGGVRSRAILFPNGRPGEVRAREAIPQQQVFLRVQSGDVLLIAARIQKYGGDEPQAGPNKRLA